MHFSNKINHILDIVMCSYFMTTVFGFIKFNKDQLKKVNSTLTIIFILDVQSVQAYLWQFHIVGAYK